MEALANFKWEMVSLIIVLGGALIGLMTPIIKLNTTITKLNTTLESTNVIVNKTVTKVEDLDKRVTILEHS